MWNNRILTTRWCQPEFMLSKNERCNNAKLGSLTSNTDDHIEKFSRAYQNKFAMIYFINIICNCSLNTKIPIKFLKGLEVIWKCLVKTGIILCKVINFQNILISCAKKIIFIVWQREWVNVLFLLLVCNLYVLRL